jgi:hypothetical protein
MYSDPADRVILASFLALLALTAAYWAARLFTR